MYCLFSFCYPFNNSKLFKLFVQLKNRYKSHTGVFLPKEINPISMSWIKEIKSSQQVWTKDTFIHSADKDFWNKLPQIKNFFQVEVLLLILLEIKGRCCRYCRTLYYSGNPPKNWHQMYTHSLSTVLSQNSIRCLECCYDIW